MSPHETLGIITVAHCESQKAISFQSHFEATLFTVVDGTNVLYDLRTNESPKKMR